MQMPAISVQSLRSPESDGAKERHMDSGGNARDCVEKGAE